MKLRWGRFRVLLSLLGFGIALPVNAQSIVPAVDGTGTLVELNGQRYDIQGGSLSGDGANLFHSFQDFGLDTGEMARFLSQPHIQNILSRTIGGHASHIDGLIQVTGGNSNLFLMNPAGIVFGTHAQLDIPAAFTATTATGIGFDGGWFNAIGDNQYAALVGHPTAFAFATPHPGSIVNAGNLAVGEGNSIALLGGTVVNTGTLSAPGGAIAIAAVPGESLVRISQPGMLLNLEVEPLSSPGFQPLPFNPLTLPALLTESNINHATGTRVESDGTLWLTGSGLSVSPETGTLIASGTLNASLASDNLEHPIQNPKSKIQNPLIDNPSIDLLGNRIGLIGANLDVSGLNAGGTIRIGGNPSGNTGLNASRTTISRDSTLRADALLSGDGGQVSLWSDDITGFFGHISARGGLTAGAGGRVSISGQSQLAFDGIVDVSATAGLPGTLRLDPTNITISNAANSPAAVDPSMAILAGDFAAMDIIVNAASLEGQAGNILLEATNNIIIAPGVMLNFVPGGTIALAADAGVADGVGALLMNAGSTLNTNDRSLTITAATIELAASSLIDAGSGDVTFQPSTTASTIGLGDGASGTFNLSTTELTANLNTSGTLTVGTPGFTGTGEVQLQNLASLSGENYNLTVRGGDIRFFFSTDPIVQLADNKTIQFISTGTIFEGGALDVKVGGANGALLFDSANGFSAFPDTGLGGIDLDVANVAVRARNSGDILLDFRDRDITISTVNGVSGISTVNNGRIALGQAFGSNINLIVNQPIQAEGSGDISLGRGVTAQINLNSSINAGSGDIRFEVPVILGTNLGEIATVGGEIAFASTVDGNQAVVLNAGDGTVQFNDTVGGTTPLASLTVNSATTTTSTGALNIATIGDIFTGDINNPGRGISLRSGSGSIFTGNLSSAGTSGGSVFLAANNAIETGAIATTGLSQDGGAITLSANDTITTDTLDSSSQLTSGGDINLSASDDIQIVWLNAQGGDSGSGGTTDITTNAFFRASGTFTDRNNTLASLSTAGGLGSGPITIRHGGNGIIPFDVGNANLNGTVAAITSGPTTIQPFQSFPFTEIRNNISIISVDPPAATLTLDPSLPAPPRTTFPPVQPTAALLEATCDVVDTGIGALEGKHTRDFEQKLGITSGTSVKGLIDACTVLGAIAAETGIKPALIYVNFIPQSLTASELSSPDATIHPPPSTLHPSPFTKTLPPAIPSLQKLQAALQTPRWRWRPESPLAIDRPITPQPQERSLPATASDQLELVIVTPTLVIRKRLPTATRRQVQKTANQLLGTVTNRNKLGSTDYLAPAQQLYQWLIAPLEGELKAQNIDHLVFIMDTGLRSLPLATLHDGQNFIIERYSVGLMPSLSLTDTRYRDIRDQQVLAMGAETFTPAANQSPLPGVPLELAAITTELWPGQSFLNQDFTPKRLKQARRTKPFGIIHLATHAEFWPDAPDSSYIQFWNQKQTFTDLRQANLFGSPIELAVFSACRTALGNEEKELGFAGLAVQAGVKSALGSLWYVSDEGTTSFMASFYQQLKQVPIKAEAVRRTQLAMLQGEVRLEAGNLVTPGSLSGLSLPAALAELGDKDLTHPYYWSGFVLVGNPW